MTALGVGTSTLTLNNYLKIVQQSLTDNFSREAKLWDFVYGRKKGGADGKYLIGKMRAHPGVGSVGSMGSSTTATFLGGHKSSISEYIAYYKAFGLTVEVDYDIMQAALNDFGRYGEPIAEEVDGKVSALARERSIISYMDGSGVVGTVGTTITDSGAYVTLDIATADTTRGSVNFFVVGDKYVITDTSGTARTSASGVTPDYWLCTIVDRDNNQVALQPYDSSDSALTFNGSTDDVAATDLIYRKAIYDDTGTVHSITAGTNDLGTASADWPGLMAWDGTTSGHKVNNVTLTGNFIAAKKSAGGSALDPQHFQNCLSYCFINAGQNKYVYDTALMSYETYDKLVEANEVDKRFASSAVGDRGFAQMYFAYGSTKVDFEPDQFCHHKRIFIPPKGDAIQYIGSDFQWVDAGNQQEFLKVNSSGVYMRQVMKFMFGQGAFNICHPAAMGVIHNFT